MRRARLIARSGALHRARGLLALVAIVTLLFAVACEEIEDVFVDEAEQWPHPNADLSNTRHTPASDIDSGNVDELDVAWTFAPPGLGEYGAIAGAPLVVDGVVYFQDLGNNVFALDLETGEVIWEAQFEGAALGPNGPAIAGNRLFVSLGDQAEMAALDLETGEVLWRQEVDTEAHQPLAMGDTVFAITAAEGYVSGNSGFAYAMDAETGEIRWSFQVVEEGFWGNPEVNSGGGLWMPPALDEGRGLLYFGTGNPGPFPGTVDYPNATSREEPNLYANSLIVLDAETGELVWYDYVEPDDLFDLDFHLSPILLDGVEVEGETRDVVLGAGKNGKVFAWNRDTEEQLWMTEVGIHQNNELTELELGEPVEVYPGILGGVETPMAVAGGVVYVPVVNLPTVHEATGHGAEDGFEALLAADEHTPVGTGTGELVAIEIATGDVLWQVELDEEIYGGATVVNDLVFTATLSGVIYAFDRETGDEMWTLQAPAGINAWPAVHGDTIIWGAGSGPEPQLLALRLGAEGVVDVETPTPTPTPEPTPTPVLPPDADEVTLEITTPSGSQFDTDELRAPAGAEVTVIYRNESDIPHNIAFYEGDDATAPLVARTNVEAGPVTQELTFTAPEEPGEYYFQCDPHPVLMNGVFIVE